MNRLYLLDTNTVSYIVKDNPKTARNRLASLQPGEIACISAVTEGELLYGIAKSSAGEQRRNAITWLLTRLQILPWGREAAASYGILRAKQERLGKTLGPLDMQIAAHAIAVGAVLVTSDKALQRITDLPNIQDWANNTEFLSV